MQFDFISKRSIVEATDLLQSLMERQWSQQKDPHTVFIDLEKAYYGVPREVLKAMEKKKEVFIAYNWAIKNIYVGVKASLQTYSGVEEDP